MRPAWANPARVGTPWRMTQISYTLPGGADGSWNETCRACELPFKATAIAAQAASTAAEARGAALRLRSRGTTTRRRNAGRGGGSSPREGERGDRDPQRLELVLAVRTERHVPLEGARLLGVERVEHIPGRLVVHQKT